MKCPRCQREISPEAVSCSSCGFSFNDATQPLDYPSDSPAKPASPAQAPSPSAKSDRRSFTSLDSIDDARFVPGTILAERYRIVGLLGKGGMGEVYRADDLKLAQPVALKFLPDHLLSDAGALARFHREVRVARQVSHKNVCRVYDIGEIDGRHFLSMEFIRGEELSSLLRRIGRLPQDKALQLARQICAGLAAAHDIGIIHRDLKPANIMIDGDGNARVLDFGLGGLAEEFGEEEIRAGTPAYMSPEQIEGKEQTVRSDLYSLGLVLYELFTGKRAFEAPTLNELIKLRRSETMPTTPTSIVKGLDPMIEKVIDRCLQKNPELRPQSALQVAAALPGGDPLAAALAAGETPSPEM
ncbi:MAG TPA: protein kinase, partial [Pyrinomonadaceae bacterium]